MRALAQVSCRGQFTVDRENVVHETIDGETILVQLETGNYYSLRGTGAEIWSLLESGHSTDEVIALLRQRYDADAEVIEDVTYSLAEELVGEQLLTPFRPVDGEQVQRFAVSLPEPEDVLAPPQLDKFTDMQGFLLQDPIHESDAEGWPHRRPEATPVGR